MEVENQTPLGENTQPVDTAPVTDTTPVDSSDSAPEGQPTLQTEQPAWTPDFKFKVMDKEYEIDPLFRSIIKDEETLKKVRRMHEQVYGLPHLEASRDEFKTKYNQVMPRLQEYDNVERKLGKLSHFVQNKDFGSFFDELKIPRAAILNWVKAELESDGLPPHVKAEVERARQLASQQYDATTELERYRQQEAMAQQQQVFSQVNDAIRDLAGDVAEQFNSRINEPNAFFNAVMNKGAHIQETTGQKAPLSQVIALVKQDLARVMGITEATAQAHAQATAQQGQAAQPNQAPQAQAPMGKPPVIPNVKAGAASPVKTPPKSIADLRKLAASMD